MAFHLRLRHAVVAAGFDPDVHGESARFHRMLLDRGVKVSVQAVYAWLSGEYLPKLAHAIAIADALGIHGPEREAMINDLAGRKPDSDAKVA